jgi:hypothetical protein
MEISKLLFLDFNLFKLTVLYCTLVVTDNVHAQEPEKQGVTINTELSLLSESNVQRNIDETSDNLISLAPQLKYLNGIGKHQFSASYRGKYTKYSEVQQFDYENHIAEIGVLFAHSARLTTQLSTNYEDTVEKPGVTNQVLMDVTELNRFNRTQFVAKMSYGTSKSRGQVDLGLEHNTTDYTNNEQQFRSVDIINMTGSYFYRIAANTRLLVELGAADFDYTDVEEFNDQSNQEHRYLTGIEWASGAQTTSVFKLGYLTKNFENLAFTDINALSYSLDFIWKPKSYTQLKLGASRIAKESAIQGTAGFISKAYSVDLQHELSRLIVLNSKVQYAESDFALITNTNTEFQFGLTYSAKHWLDITLSYTLENRESNEPLFDFDSEVIQLSFITNFD